MDDNRKKIILEIIGVVFLVAALLATGGYLVNRIVTTVRNLDTEHPCLLANWKGKCYSISAKMSQ